MVRRQHCKQMKNIKQPELGVFRANSEKKLIWERALNDWKPSWSAFAAFYICPPPMMVWRQWWRKPTYGYSFPFWRAWIYVERVRSFGPFKTRSPHIFFFFPGELPSGSLEPSFPSAVSCTYVVPTPQTHRSRLSLPPSPPSQKKVFNQKLFSPSSFHCQARRLSGRFGTTSEVEWKEERGKEELEGAVHMVEWRGNTHCHRPNFIA